VGVQVGIDAGLAARCRQECMPSEGTTHAASSSTYLEPANLFVAWLLTDLLHLVAGGIVGSMPLSRTQQQAADLFQAAGAQESCRTRTPARLTSAQQSAAVVSAAERLSSRHVLPRDLSNALKQLDDGEPDRLFTATRLELQRRGRLLTSTPVNRPTTYIGWVSRRSPQLLSLRKLSPALAGPL
jgi:hypothetical protein